MHAQVTVGPVEAFYRAEAPQGSGGAFRPLLATAQTAAYIIHSPHAMGADMIVTGSAVHAEISKLSRPLLLYPKWAPYAAGASLMLGLAGLSASAISPGISAGWPVPFGLAGIWFVSRFVRER